MKIIRTGKDNLQKIIAKKNITGDMVRLSGFVFVHKNSRTQYIKHTITGEVIELDPGEYELICTLKEHSLSADMIRSKGLDDLIRKRYIVDVSYVEADHYKDVHSILKIMKTGRNKGLSKYTILPTTACNARCVYCFENGFVPETMTYETADRLVEYIMKTKNEGRITLEWFGGEPFAAHGIISYICRKITEESVEFSSVIVTNGSLITDELVEEAVNTWKLKRAQVSVDGSRAQYELRKAYKDKRYNYDVVMDNIGRLARAGVKVIMRCNLDRGNIDDVDEFFDDIYDRFAGYDNVRIYLAPLHQEMKLDSITELHQAITDLYDKTGRTPKGRMFSMPGSKSGMKYNYCFADSMEHAVIIMPDGSFTNCENLPAGHNWGNVRDGITDEELYKKLTTPAAIDPKCSTCCFLPECTPTRKPCCPVTNERCYECKVIDTVFDLDHLKCEETEDEEDDPC